MTPESEAPIPSPSSVKALGREVIDPKELMTELSVEELNRFSDRYYRRLPLPEYQMAKPFSMTSEAAQLFSKLGLALEGLDLGPTMRVLDFGAGTCWLSKMIWQMGCSVVAVDVSETALAIGRRLFEEFPVPMPPKADWQTLLFDGRRLEIEDGSIDRIVAFDVFHHVPNQAEVAAEFFRVLREGGTLVLSEPVGAHSKEPDAQDEMREYGVLENDLEVDALSRLFQERGFTAPVFKLFASPGLELSERERQECIENVPGERVVHSIRDALRDSAVIVFRKGLRRLDSRRAEGLAHEMELSEHFVLMDTRRAKVIRIKLRNTGRSEWLCRNTEDRGIVKVGTQLLDSGTGELILDHGRWALPNNVAPGESLELNIDFTVNRPGRFKVRFDLVSELVCWFRVLGSKEVFLEAQVTEG